MRSGSGSGRSSSRWRQEGALTCNQHGVETEQTGKEETLPCEPAQPAQDRAHVVNRQLVSQRAVQRGDTRGEVSTRLRAGARGQPLVSTSRSVQYRLSAFGVGEALGFSDWCWYKNPTNTLAPNPNPRCSARVVGSSDSTAC